MKQFLDLHLNLFFVKKFHYIKLKKEEKTKNANFIIYVEEKS